MSSRQPQRILLDGNQLTWEQLELILGGQAIKVELCPQAREQMSRVREEALTLLRTDHPPRIYGWNQGLGPLKIHPLTLQEQEQFQQNVLLSHHAGVGNYLPEQVARLALVIRANVLARGTAGVRPELVERILKLVNSGLVPLIPQVGSMGTGDLQPMAAVGLALVGHPQAQLLCPQGSLQAARQAYQKLGLEADFPLQAGEAIGLISGSAVLSASLAWALQQVKEQLTVFTGSFALFCEASRAEKQAFDLRMHRERHIPAEEQSAQQILSLIADSHWGTQAGRRLAGEEQPRVQDSTSVRSVPHQLAAVIQEIERACQEISRDVNASTCNPILLPREGGGVDFISGGNWDGTILGQVAHSLNVSITRLAVLAKDLAGRLLHEGWSYGLPPSLSGGQLGLNSGMTLLYTTGASLIPEMQVRANPVSTLSFPIKGGQEDHNTMAMAGVNNLLSNLGRLNTVLAVFLLLSAQGIHLLQPLMGSLPLGSGSEQIYRYLRQQVAPLEEDRPLVEDLETARALIADGTLASYIQDLLEWQGPDQAGSYII
ncbi:MAG: aromatic amino acid ammonia-lyase [Rothia sp. (in: high G+C Gram-positive bacteria)]|nr:aromatic amino acid ammonia-lyase [Rothia sp. (in: high G+C Gram-positive bacteria)]